MDMMHDNPGEARFETSGSYKVKTSCKDGIYLNAANGKASLLSDLAIRTAPTHDPSNRNL